MQPLAEHLAQYGLVPARGLDRDKFEEIQSLRSPLGVGLDYAQLRKTMRDHKWARDYLYVSTGFDPLIILNTGTGEYVNPQPLVYADMFDDENLRKQVDVVKRHVEAWRDGDTFDSLLDRNDTEGFKRTVMRAVTLAPNNLKELIYFLVPWDKTEGMNLEPFRRVVALRIRKTEEYPSEYFDNMLVPLLESTQPVITPVSDDEPPEEEILTEPVTVYRGEIGKSHHLALSWTRRRDIAEGFAQRFKQQGVVYEATIPPERVLAAYASDNEREILVNDLTGITIKERRVQN